jgi:hypothetical protein
VKAYRRNGGGHPGVIERRRKSVNVGENEEKWRGDEGNQ